MQLDRVSSVKVPCFIGSQRMKPGNFIFFQQVENGSTAKTLPRAGIHSVRRFESPPIPTAFLMRRELQSLDCKFGSIHEIQSFGCQPYRQLGMVGTVRFELTASCSQSRRANQTTLRPVKSVDDKQFTGNKQSNSTRSSAILESRSFSVCKNASRYHDALIRLWRTFRKQDLPGLTWRNF